MGWRKRLGRIWFLRTGKNFVYNFIYEYLGNHCICLVPFWRLRYIFFHYILRERLHRTSFMCHNVYQYAPQKITIGRNAYVNLRAILDGRGGLNIGDNVSIGIDAHIFTAGHILNTPDFRYYEKEVTISNRVWLGDGVKVMPGVHIGEGAVILAGAVVTKDVAPYAIMAGIPCHKIAERTQELTYDSACIDWFR